MSKILSKYNLNLKHFYLKHVFWKQKLATKQLLQKRGSWARINTTKYMVLALFYIFLDRVQSHFLLFFTGHLCYLKKWGVCVGQNDTWSLIFFKVATCNNNHKMSVQDPSSLLMLQASDVLVNWLSDQKKKSWCVVFPSFCGVNAPTLDDFQLLMV